MRALRAALLPAGLAIVLWAAWAVPLPVFVERPGALLSLGDQISVGAGTATELDGDYLLPVANLRRATMIGLVQGWLDPNAGFIRQERLIPPGIDDDAYFARQRDVFREAADIAAAVGLAAAGFPADPDDVVGDGAVVMRVMEGLPADGLLEPGDEIITADGAPVRTAEDLSTAVAGSAARPLELTLHREGRELTATVTPEIRAVGGEQRPIIGVEIQTLRPRVQLPVPVEVDAGRIGGPSAGLLIALTVYDKADAAVDLSAGRRIAGTGGLDADGTVQSVGAVQFKVLAADPAGADIFLVPAQQLDIALDALPPGSQMEVIGVSTFEEALEALRSRGARTASWPLATLARPAPVIAGRAPVRSRATPHREPGQGRKAAAISGSRRAPRGSRTGLSARR
jgi:Lon-like protease